ncbi:MAG: Cof-type HAD-IIB family hydrolase [Clostridiales Family XIII bacterium]|jgi:Cof subfamily protein (haloacid dehalogenase superfamily)|nr:Cof-type HAD-IIB family hydrolase [Clostridiales Family XIII bacterium]
MAKIKLIALDLDKTLLNSEGKLSEGNRKALVRAIEAGIIVVPATGRAKSTVPPEILDLGARYLICGNGALIFDIPGGKKLYEKLIPAEGLERMKPFLDDTSFMKEAFYEGVPYTDEIYYSDMARFGVSGDFLEYYKASRSPVKDLAAFIEERKDSIEVINMIFADGRRKASVWKSLEEIDIIEVTTSLGFNLEVGARGMSKASAMSALCGILGIEPSQALSCGDNDNDASMLEFAGIGVAMGNATPNAKAAADFVTKTNDEDGVAFAIEKFAL